MSKLSTQPSSVDCQFLFNFLHSFVRYYILRFSPSVIPSDTHPTTFASTYLHTSLIQTIYVYFKLNTKLAQIFQIFNGFMISPNCFGNYFAPESLASKRHPEISWPPKKREKNHYKKHKPNKR